MPWKRDGVSEPNATIRLIAVRVDHVGPHKARSGAVTLRIPNVYVVLFDDNARTNTPFKSSRVYVTSVMNVFSADVK